MDWRSENGLASTKVYEFRRKQDRETTKCDLFGSERIYLALGETGNPLIELGGSGRIVKYAGYVRGRLEDSLQLRRMWLNWI